MHHPPSVIWFTGLSGSGKTTIATALEKKLKTLNFKTELLDGDAIRDIFPQTGFSKSDRIAHAKRVGFLASLLEKHGITAICSLITPYKESRDYIRSLSSHFLEIYLSTPLEVCEARDPKGLYKKARKGEIKNFTGINDPYEAPLNPEISIDTSCTSIDDAVLKILNHLTRDVR